MEHFVSHFASHVWDRRRSTAVTTKSCTCAGQDAAGRDAGRLGKPLDKERSRVHPFSHAPPVHRAGESIAVRPKRPGAKGPSIGWIREVPRTARHQFGPNSREPSGYTTDPLLGIGVGGQVIFADSTVLAGPIIMATIMSEWSRDPSEDGRLSFGLSPTPGRGWLASTVLRL